MVVDGEEQARYDGFVRSALTFSPDSQRLVYAVAVGKQYAVVVDEPWEQLYDAVWPPVLARTAATSRTPR